MQNVKNSVADALSLLSPQYKSSKETGSFSAIVEQVSDDLSQKTDSHNKKKYQPTISEKTTAQQIEEWANKYVSTGISHDRRESVYKNKTAFAQIVQRATKQNAYTSPKSFLRELSPRELAVLQNMHGLTDTIDVEDLSEEGAYNLIMIPGKGDDINNDGLVEYGKAVTWSFPEPNASESVKQAWAKATEGMSPEEIMLAMAPFMVYVVEHNIEYNEQGQAVGIYEAGDDRYTNPFADENFSYMDMMDFLMDKLEKFRAQTDPAQYAAQKDFLTKFKDALEEFEVS